MAMDLLAKRCPKWVSWRIADAQSDSRMRTKSYMTAVCSVNQATTDPHTPLFIFGKKLTVGCTSAKSSLATSRKTSLWDLRIKSFSRSTITVWIKTKTEQQCVRHASQSSMRNWWRKAVANASTTHYSSFSKRSHYLQISREWATSPPTCMSTMIKTILSLTCSKRLRMSMTNTRTSRWIYGSTRALITSFNAPSTCCTSIAATRILRSHGTPIMKRKNNLQTL